MNADLNVRELCNAAAAAYHQKDYATAVRFYTRAALLNDASALNWLGFLYENGMGVDKNETKAAQYYTKSANMGHADAQKSLGICYQFGRGVVKNLRKAVLWYGKAAEQGSISAQYNLGWCYAHGTGVTQDLKLSFYWYEKAARGGHANAQFNLACAYYNGAGVELDYAQAALWFGKAAEQNVSDAAEWRRKAIEKWNAAYRWLETPPDVKKNTSATPQQQSREEIRKAAEHGDAVAQVKMGVLCIEAGKTPENLKAGMEYFLKAAGRADMLSKEQYGFVCYCLGSYYLDPTGGAAPVNGVKWLKECVKNAGSLKKEVCAKAYLMLGDCYMTGRGVKKNKNDAAMYYGSSSRCGGVDANSRLGACYLKGCGVKKDKAMGVEFLSSAAKAGNANAQFLLGLCYLKGMGVKTDMNRGEYWLNLAGKNGHRKALKAMKHPVISSMPGWLIVLICLVSFGPFLLEFLPLTVFLLTVWVTVIFIVYCWFMYRIITVEKSVGYGIMYFLLVLLLALTGYLWSLVFRGGETIFHDFWNYM